MTFAELRVKNRDYETGWGCNGAYFDKCARAPDLDNGDIYEELYHDKELEVDFCIDCGDKFNKGEDDDDSYGNEDEESVQN